MSVLQGLVSLVACKIYGINEYEARESKNSLVRCRFKRIIIFKKQLILEAKKVFFIILVSLTVTISKTLFVHFNKC